MSGPCPTVTEEGNDQVKDKMPIANPEVENPEKEDRTLTDHLNKKLLESFLTRIDAGTTGFPNLPQAPPEVKEPDSDFD